MTKLGLHVSAGDRHGIGDVLATGGVKAIFSVDQDMDPDRDKYSPSTILIFRTALKGDNPQGFFDSAHQDMAALATGWMANQLPIWAKNKANYYAPGNEIDPGTVSQASRLSDYYVGCMDVAEQNGLHLAIGNFSSGCPADGLLPDGTPDPVNTLEAKLAAMLPMFRRAHQGNHILCLHVHTSGSVLVEQTGESIGLRFNRITRYLLSVGCAIPIVISEWSNGAGGIQPNTVGWRNSISVYDQMVAGYPWLIAYCLYQYGGAENIKDQSAWLVDYILSHAGTPTPPPPPTVTYNFNASTTDPLTAVAIREALEPLHAAGKLTVYGEWQSQT